MKAKNGAPRSLNPTQFVSIGFFGLIVAGGVLLMMPFSSASGTMTPMLPAFFTSTSAVSLTGLATVDTGSHWSIAGQAIIAGLIQLSGFGIMSLTSLAGMLLTGRIGLRSRMNAQAEGRSLSVGGVKSTLFASLALSVATEAIVSLILASRFVHEYGMSTQRAFGEGVFHAISSFNNAGFGLRQDSMVPYVGDAWIIIPIAGSLMIGGLGFPVLRELVDRFWSLIAHPKSAHHRKRITITTRMTMLGTVILIIVGWLSVAVLEWNKAMKGLSLDDKILASFFQAVSPRTAGFNSLDYGAFHPSTLFITDILMFIGGGSAGTAGGVKITTMMVLIAAMVAEFRGEEDTVVDKRRIDQSVVRQAMTVFALGIGLVTLGVVIIMFTETRFTGSQILFEVTSAFGTVGLTTGITPYLTAPSQIVLCVIMYLGRIGPITLVTALAQQKIARRYRYPEERPFIG